MCCIVPNKTIVLFYQIKKMEKQNLQRGRFTTRVIFFILLATIVTITKINAQPKQNVAEKKDLATTELFNEIGKMDSLLFNAYNTHNLDLLKTFFTEDLEFYHDKDGLITYSQMINGFKNIIARNDGINRQLVKESLQVYPLGNYGAIQIGEHRFCHIENGKNDCGNFQFVHVWQKKDGQWKISRVISYGH